MVMWRRLKAVLNMAGYWQTWVWVVGVGITTWEAIAAHTRGLPVDEVLLRASAVAALTFGGALFFVRLWGWAQEAYGRDQAVKRVREVLHDLQTHRHTAIKLSDLARLWSGSTWNEPGGRQTFDEWRKWNSKLRELKDAANTNLIEVESNPDGRVTLRTMLRIESALRFFTSSEWKNLPTPE